MSNNHQQFCRQCMKLLTGDDLVQSDQRTGYPPMCITCFTDFCKMEETRDKPPQMICPACQSLATLDHVSIFDQMIFICESCSNKELYLVDTDRQERADLASEREIGTCSDCRWCFGQDNIVRECRRYPPDGRGFPRIHLMDYCGEWTPQ